MIPHKTLIHAFITSRIDYCNSHPYGQPKCVSFTASSLCPKLSASRLIYLCGRDELVNLVLITLLFRVTF